MEKLKNNLLEENEAIAILVGFIIGTSILALPNAVVEDAKQDGWIAVIVGGWYPLFMAGLSIYYVKKHPNENILVLSKKYLGKILGTICNILFMAEFGVFTIFAIASLSNIFRVYATPFLTPIKIIIPLILMAIYLTNKEIKVLARINIIALIFIIVLTMTQIAAIVRGNYLNIFPVFGTGYKNIFKGSIQSALAYGGMEAIFLFYPMIREKNKIKNITFKATFITMAIYTSVTFASIYCLGYKLTSKSLWPTLMTTEAVNLPVINSYRFIFLFLWSLAMFKIIANEHYATIFILSDIFKIKDKIKIYWITVPIIIYFCLKLGNEVQRRDYLSFIVPKVSIFIISYISIIALLIFIKDKCGKEKNKD